MLIKLIVSVIVVLLILALVAPVIWSKVKQYLPWKGKLIDTAIDKAEDAIDLIKKRSISNNQQEILESYIIVKKHLEKVGEEHDVNWVNSIAASMFIETENE